MEDFSTLCHLSPLYPWITANGTGQKSGVNISLVHLRPLSVKNLIASRLCVVQVMVVMLYSHYLVVTYIIGYCILYHASGGLADTSTSMFPDVDSTWKVCFSFFLKKLGTIFVALFTLLSSYVLLTWSFMDIFLVFYCHLLT
jgi:hypothetical protein